jgi:anti-anti-sigma factor
MEKPETFRGRLALRNDRRDVPRLGDWIDGIEERCVLSSRTAFALRLCLEEIAINIVSYAYDPGAEGLIEIELRCEGQVVEAVLRDRGRPFNPLTHAALPVATNLDEAQIGGVGISLVRHFAKRLSYERVGESNNLTIMFDAAETAKQPAQSPRLLVAARRRSADTTPESGSEAVIAPVGRLDATTVPALEREMTDALRHGATLLLIDLTDLTFISSAGLRVILLTAREAKALGARMALCAANQLVREVFEASGLTAILHLYPGREEAAAANDDPAPLR